MDRLTPEEDEGWELHRQTVASCQNGSDARPTEEQVAELLRRIREGMTTSQDADMVKRWLKAKGEQR